MLAVRTDSSPPTVLASRPDLAVHTDASSPAVLASGLVSTMHANASSSTLLTAMPFPAVLTYTLPSAFPAILLVLAVLAKGAAPAWSAEVPSPAVLTHARCTRAILALDFAAAVISRLEGVGPVNPG